MTGKKEWSSLPLHLQNILYHLNALERHLPKMQFIFLKVKCISLVKKVEAVIVHLGYSCESNLGKILGLFLCLKLDVYCLLAVTLVQRLNVASKWLNPRRVSLSAACPKFLQRIRSSGRSATLWTKLWPRAPFLLTAWRCHSQELPGVETRTGTITSQLQNPSHNFNLACSWLPWGNWWGEEWYYCTKVFFIKDHLCWCLLHSCIWNISAFEPDRK